VARYDFLDWLKAIGITFVVYGHVAHATTVPLTPPVYLKQFGVICFLFATTFTLARETRSTFAAVFARLFPIFFFGLSTAVVLSAIGAIAGTGLLPSNYLPFTFGANIVFNNFPANPSTWYLGTYIHLIVAWAVLRGHLHVPIWIVLAAVVLEVPIRAVLVTSAGPYVAYMALTNWLAVCLFGLWWGRRFDAEPGPRRPFPRGVVLITCAVVVGVSTRAFVFEPAFPFMSITAWPSWTSALAVSAMASALYLAGAVVLFEVTRSIGPAPRVVTFLARNSLLIFLIHMPVYFALRPILIELGLDYGARAAVQFVVCLPVLALLSEGILRLVSAKTLAQRTAAAVEGWREGLRRTPASLAQGR
jgi:fucose 4-O-acetylase-like acetyltransferase